VTELDAKPKPLGRLEGAVARLFARPATLTSVREVADGFRWLTLSGPALCGVEWSPGQKVQLMLGGWVQRTYTPLSWDARAGCFDLLAYAHGTGPGATWVREAAPGVSCMVFGPRGSVDLPRLARPALLFGDETSFGLARALRSTRAAADGVALLLEVSSMGTSRAALDALGIEGAVLSERRPGDAHWDELREHATRLVQAHELRAGVLSGKATSIRALGQHLRQLGVPRAGLQTKAYWAPGKTGLD
jgi:NADPH-dependent ferric siderophore reductase